MEARASLFRTMGLGSFSLDVPGRCLDNSSRSAMTLTASTRLGPYEVLASIGAGGMGEVYRARDTKLNRVVAIKVLPESVASDQTLRTIGSSMGTGQH